MNEIVWLSPTKHKICFDQLYRFLIIHNDKILILHKCVLFENKMIHTLNAFDINSTICCRDILKRFFYSCLTEPQFRWVS